MSEEVVVPVAEEPHPLDPSAPQEAEPEQPEGEAEAEGEQEEKKETKNYSQEEVDRIVRKAKKNASYLARKEAEAEIYRQQVEKGTQRAPEPVQDAAPKREDFDDYETYLEARADYRADQKVRTVLAEQQARTQYSTQQNSEAQRLARYQQDLDKARTSIPDFDEVTDAADVPVTQTMRDAILESEVGALLTYHLAKHPLEAERIARLSPVAQAKAIGAIEATLATKPAPRVSKAPAPIRPISGSSGGHADPSKMTMDEYTAYRKKGGAAWARR
jgi:hypothetical protein